MSIQIYSYGAFIRLVTDSSVLMLAKSQVKSIEVVRDDTVKISNGAGTLNEIMVKFADVTHPAGLVDVAALRDAISHMLDNANIYEEVALIKLQSQIDQLQEIKQLFNLWHSSLQIDLNFQQLQVNALVAINNRLLEAKENEERLIDEVEEQVTVLKDQSVKLVALDGLITAIKTAGETSLLKQDAHHATLTDIKAQQQSNGILLTAIKAANETALTKQDGHLGLLTEIKITDGQIKTILADILNELKAQTNKLSTIDTTLGDIRSKSDASLVKQETHTQLLTAIKNSLADHS